MRILIISSFIFSLFMGSSYIYADSPIQHIAAECTTKGTEPSGARNKCSSDVTSITAPENHVFAKNTLAGGEFSGAGDSHDCLVSWDNEVAILPDGVLTQPRTINLQAQAVSPGGMPNVGKRGWAKCKYSVQVSKYK